MKQKFIEWFTKNNNGCSPAMEDDRSFVYEMTQNMFEAYQAGVAEGEAKCAALAAENAGLKSKAAELVHEASEVYSAYNSTITEPDGDFMDMQTLQEMQCVETPATDSFLAEVRAQGVQQLAIHMELNGYSNEAAGAREYAASIRKGAAQ
ncbi:hypothetical protein N8V85_17615 [Enterobacter hormaechei subsp. hoffmannii]|nr:hypothetical protein [Enterobacter hormaechei subsp. hoffmannii]